MCGEPILKILVNDATTILGSYSSFRPGHVSQSGSPDNDNGTPGHRSILPAPLNCFRAIGAEYNQLA